MRTVSTPVMNAMTTSRQIGGRLTIRDTRLVFDDLTNTLDEPFMYDDFGGYDACEMGATGLLRIAAWGNPRSLWYQYIPDVSVTPWPAWEPAGINLSYYHKPGLSNGRVWFSRYLNGTYGRIAYADFNTVSEAFGSYVDTTSDFAHTLPLSMAPVSTTELYVLTKLGYETDAVPSSLYYVKLTGGTLPDDRQWKGRVYGPGLYYRTLDAVRLADRDVVFLTDHEDRRTMQVSYFIDSEIWSDVEPVLPLDIIDDTSMFLVGGANVINSKMFITGLLKRPEGMAAQTYMIGNDGHWSLGRDMFIGTTGALVRSEFGGTLDPVAGKAHLIGDYVYYLGPDIYYRAPASLLVGYDNPDLKETIINFNNMQASFSRAAGLRSFSLDISTDHDVIDAGAQVTAEVSYGGNYATLFTGEVDSGNDGLLEDSRENNIIGRGEATRRITQWVSDADYDYWGQACVAGNPITMDKHIQVSGDFDVVGSELVLNSLNDDGIFYSTGRASRGYLARARVYIPQETAEYSPKVGVVLNFRRQTKAEAALELEKDVDDVLPSEYGMSGIYAIWSPTEHSGGPGFAIYKVNNGVWSNKLTSAYASPTRGAWIDVMGEFRDGRIRVLWKLASSTTYTQVIDTTYFAIWNPWPSEERGRAGIYLKNDVLGSTTPGFDQGSNVIPVISTAEFPISESSTNTVQVDEEYIWLDGKTATTALSDDMNVVDGLVYEDVTQPHDNSGFVVPPDSYAVWVDGVGTPVSQDIYNGFALAVTEGYGEGYAYKIVGYDYSAPKQWVVTETYDNSFEWKNHIGDPAHGYWEDANMRRFFVDREPSASIRTDVKVTVYPALHISQRGAGGSKAVSHSEAQVSVYTNSRVKTNFFEAYSVDKDRSYDWMFKEVAYKSGVRSATSERLYDTSVVLSGSLATQYALTFRQRDATFVGKVKPIGTYSGVTEIGLSMSIGAANGYLVTVRTDTVGRTTQVRKYTVSSGGTATLAEAIPVPYTPLGWITFSRQKTFVSVWVDDYYLYTFDSFGSDEIGLYANRTLSVQVDWPVLDQRVDNFFMEMGTTGVALIQRLIGQRRIFFNDTQDGGIYFFRNRVEVNAANPYGLSIVKTGAKTDASIVTRVRLEGLHVAEGVDYAAMKLYGNRFSRINMQELEHPEQFQSEAGYIIEDALRSYYRYNIVGPADPRLEPDDIYHIDLPDGDIETVVDAVTYSLSQSEKSAVFDMTVEGRGA